MRVRAYAAGADPPGRPCTSAPTCMTRSSDHMPQSVEHQTFSLVKRAG
jgi:hypothetical protein